MTGNARKYVLSGYLAVAMAGIVFALTRSHKLLALLQSAAAQAAPLLALGARHGDLHPVACRHSVLFGAYQPFILSRRGVPVRLRNRERTGRHGHHLGVGGLALFFCKTTSSPPVLQRLKVKNVFLMLALIRCSPWLPSPLINVFCGMARVPFSTFFVSTVFGTLPLVCAYTLVASRLRGPITVSILHSPELLAALTVFSVISLLGFLQPLHVVISHLRGSSIPTPKVAS